MFERLNKLAGEVVKAATLCRRQHLAAEIYSYLPVTDGRSFRNFEAQLRVVRTLLKLRPSMSKRLVEALNKLVDEAKIVDGILRNL